MVNKAIKSAGMYFLTQEAIIILIDNIGINLQTPEWS